MRRDLFWRRSSARWPLLRLAGCCFPRRERDRFSNRCHFNRMGPIVRPARQNDASAIAAIYNQGIAERSSTFETALRSADDMLERIRTAARFPVLVAVDSNDVVLGWAAISAYRARACYAGVAEFSIYIDAKARGRGAGKLLLNRLIEEVST